MVRITASIVKSMSQHQSFVSTLILNTLTHTYSLSLIRNDVTWSQHKGRKKARGKSLTLYYVDESALGVELPVESEYCFFN